MVEGADFKSQRTSLRFNGEKKKKRFNGEEDSLKQTPQSTNYQDKIKLPQNKGNQCKEGNRGPN